MAIVIHTIPNGGGRGSNEYFYEHYREGDSVRSRYIGPVGKNTVNNDSGGKATQHTQSSSITQKKLDRNYQKAVLLSGTKPVKIIITDEDESSAAMWTWKDEKIYVVPTMLQSSYESHVQFSHDDGKKPLTRDQFIQWKFLHETGHINTYRQTGRVYGEDVETKDGVMSGTYIEERNATLYADRYIRNDQLRTSTLSHYYKTDADQKDAHQYD